MGGMEGNGLRQAIHITLRGRYNITYSGTLVLHGNVTSRLAPAGNDEVAFNSSSQEEEDLYDATGASYYVIAVVLVYGMSIVALIASHIKRRHEKMSEDKQIDKYLHDFQIIKEVHARDQYKNLKKSVMHKINWDRKKGTHRTLQKSILPLLAIGMQVGAAGHQTSMELVQQQEGHHKGKRKVYPAGRKRHSDPDISDIARLIEVNDRRPLQGRRHSYTPYVDQGQFPSLDLLSIPDSHYSLAVPVSGGSNPPGGGFTPDSASARRLRFSSSASAMSILDRSLNSISEREEDEATDITPPRRRASNADSSCDSNLPTPQNSLELPAITTTPASISNAAKLRCIGVSLTPPPDVFPGDAAHCLPSIPIHARDQDDEEISVVVDDIWARDDVNAGHVHIQTYNDSFTSEDGDDPRSSPGTPLCTSYPVSIMVEADDDDDDGEGMAQDYEDWQPEMIEPIETPRLPLSRRGSSIRDEEEDYRLTPQILLASIKFTGDTLTPPNGSPHRSRSPSLSSIMSRRGSKDRRRSAGSGSRDCDGMVEVTEDNPLQITCL